MEFESVIKMHYPHLAAVIYDDNLTSKDFNPSLTDDSSCVHNVHHKTVQINLDRSHLPSMVNSNPDLYHKKHTSKISNTTSNHFIRNLNIVSYHFDMQPHTHEIPSKDTFRAIIPSPCTEAFEKYFHGISNDQGFFDMAYTTSPNVEHVSHDNTMWENDQSQGFIFGTESNFNLAMVDSNMPKPILSANEDTIMNRRQNNQVMIKTDQIKKKNKRLQMRRISKPIKKPSIIKGQWTSEEDK